MACACAWTCVGYFSIILISLALEKELAPQCFRFGRPDSSGRKYFHMEATAAPLVELLISFAE